MPQGRTPLHIACLSNAVPAASQLLQLGGDVHSVSRLPDGVGTPLHLAVAAQNEQLISLLLQYGASPFLVHGDVTALDVAGANNNAPGVRRLEALGLFSGWLRLHREPTLVGTILGVGIRPVVRWVSVVPRYRITPGGILCRHQLRLFRHLTDATPIVVWDVESAVMATDRRSARVTVTPSGSHGGGMKPLKELTFSDAGDGSRTPAHLVEACLNRTPPRVPPMPRPAVAVPVAAAATIRALAFPSPPDSTAAPLAPPPLPPRRASQPSLAELPATTPEAREAAELEEAIRRSLMHQTSGAVWGVDTADAVEAAPPSAPPLPADAERWSTRPATAPPMPAGSPRHPDSGACDQPSNEGDDDDRLCVVCLSEPRAVGLLHGTSMHVCACPACAARLQGGPCPICRAPVERLVQFIYS
jgi:hypothetical protein